MKMRNITVNKRKYCLCRRTFIIVCGLVLALFFSAAQAKANNDKSLGKVTLQLSWYHEFHFAGYYAAQLKGYYQEEGLEVEIRERNPNLLLPVDSVLSGDADFGNATSDIMYLRMQKKPVVALAVIMQHSPWVLLVRADSGITAPEDLIGKTVSMDMSYRDAEIQVMFKNESISTDTITIVRKGPGVKNLINGTVDARVSYITSQPFELQKQGFEARVLRPINYGIDFYGDTLFTSERQIRDHPQRVAAFRRASLRGWQYAMDHPDELIDYIYSTYYADPTQVTVPYSRDHFRFEAKVMAEDLVHPSLIEIGHMNSHRWQRIADTYVALGMAEPIDTLKGFIYDPNPEPDYKWAYWTIGITVAILVIAGVGVVILFVFNRRLHSNVQLRTLELTQINKTLVQEASERMKAEGSLKESEEKFRAMFEQAAVGVAQVETKTGQFIRINNRYCDIVGYTQDEMTKTTFMKITHHADLQTDLSNMRKLINGEIRNFSMEKRYYHKDGSVVWVNLTVSPMWNVGEEPAYHIAVVEDIADRKKAVESLKESEEEYRTLTENIQDCVMRYDKQHKHIFQNAAGYKASGFTKEEFIGKTHRELGFDEKLCDLWEEKIAQVFKSGKNTNAIFEWESVEGIVFMDLRLYPEFDSVGKVKSVLGISYDITDRKKMEETLLDSEKLKSLGTITAGIAHEFNNILAVMVGSAELLDGGFEDEKELKKVLHNIIKAGDDGAEIVRNMLKFAKPEGKDASDYIFFDIRHLIDEALDFTAPRWRNMAQAQGIDYKIDKEGMREIPEAFCNTTELREVFTNIINNALDAMPEGGRLSFSTWSDDDTVFISISDTGKGMPEEVKRKIFDPFFTTRRPLGTGLGMSVSYSIIKRHGGRIEIESEVGKGATFNMSIPIGKDSIQKTVPLEPAVQVTTKKLHVLVVDDSDEMCVIMGNVFTRDGHTVKTINNGAGAIALAGKEKFDLVLCDLAMPDVYGYEVIKAINKSGKTPKIGIMTGWDEKLKPIDDEEFKVDFILKKPFKHAELAKHISDLFGADSK